MFTIAKRFRFDASHQLDGLPEGHKCGRLHGHTYTVEVELQSTVLDTVGMVHDYGHLKPFADWLRIHADHRHLNDASWLMGQNPTAEVLAAEFHGRLSRDILSYPSSVTLSAVRVSETPDTWAEYRAPRFDEESGAFTP